MDIECPTCGEPWDLHHLLHDELYEWNLPEFAIENFSKTHRFTSKDDIVLIAAETAGWRFAGNSVLSFVRCPACPREYAGILHEQVARQRRDQVVALVLVLEDDLDGLASARADMGRI